MKKLGVKNFLGLCAIAAILPAASAHAEYYNNALNPANRTTKIEMQNVTNAQKTGSVVTSVKDQGDTGTCWAFSLAALAESSLMKQLQNAGITPTLNQFDFSEKYIGWMIYALAKDEAGKTNQHPFFIPKMTTDKESLKGYPTQEPNRTFFSNLSQGGNITHQLSALWGRYLFEETGKPELQFYPKKNDVLNNQVTSVITTPSYIARNVYFNSVENDKMWIPEGGSISQLDKYKALIKDTGSLRVNYYFGKGETTDSTTGAIYSRLEKDIDHAILVVGYDDNYDFANSGLAIKPPGKGAWIVKNSWGTGYQTGDAGYYYISYYDKSVLLDYAAIIEPDVARYSMTNTHTPLYTAGDTYIIQPAPTIASKYTPTANQFIKAVSFITNSDGASYNIKILKNAESLDSKPVYTQTGTFSGATDKLAGYHTVDLNKFVLVPKGEDYIIRVTVTGVSGAKEYLNLSTSTNKYYKLSDKKMFKDEESFFLSKEGEWGDTNKSMDGAVILNGQAKETSAANGGDFTVGSLSTGKNSTVAINLGKANELYLTDIIHPTRKTLSNMTADISANEDFYGTIFGEGAVTKIGTGELSLRKDNTYTGITNVNLGILSNYASTASNVDVKSGAKYKIINNIKATTTNQRGIKNAGTIIIAANNQGIIKFGTKTDILEGSITGEWYLNTLSETAKKATNGTILIDANTNDVKGTVHIKGGTIKMSSGAGVLNLFKNATKYNKDGIKINAKTQPARVSSSAPSNFATANLSTVDLGKMVIEGTTEIDIDTNLKQADLDADLIKGNVIKNDGTDDNTANKIKLGFALDDVTFTNPGGISSIVAQGQIGKVINNSAFTIDRNMSTNSYDIAYSYDDATQEGTLRILNAAGPTSLQNALTSAVTSKYYALNTDQVLDNGWTPNLNGNDLTILGNDSEIDGNNDVRIFNVSSDKMLTIKDLSVVQGEGTAIHNEGSVAVEADNSEVKLAQNNGVNGGAIYNKDELTLTTDGNNIKVENNTATNGAAIYNDNDSDITTASSDVTAIAGDGDIIFDNNIASDKGGAIYNKGDVTLWADGGNVQIDNNQAQSGAGVYNNEGSVSIYATDKAIEFNNNTATANGGAIANDGGSVEILTQGGSVDFAQNAAQKGGAIYNTKTGAGSDPAMVDVIADEGNITFDGNVASDKGGAIYNTETANVLALDDQKISFKQTTDTIYNTGTVNFNYNDMYEVTNGVISTGAELGGTGTYNLYGGELIFAKATNNSTSHGSISHDATLSVINDAYLNLANGIKETFNPGKLQIASSTALFIAIDSIINGNTTDGDFLDAGLYTGAANSQIIISDVNLIKNNAGKSSYRIKIADDTLKSVIAENILATIEGYRSAYSSSTGDLLLLSTDIKGLIDYVESEDSTRTYSMTEDELAIFPLGDMGGENSTLTIEGNNKKIISEFSDIDGITVTATNTLKVNNVSFENFETAITNQGLLNLNNVIFNGQGGTYYDVNNSGIMTAENIVVGKILNSGTFVAGTTNNFSNLFLKTTNGSILDLHNTTNDVNLQSLTIAGSVDLYLNGVNKLSSQAVSGDIATDSLNIKSITEIKTINTTITGTSALIPFIKIADDVSFSLADAAKYGTYSAYKLAYSGGDIFVNGVNLSDTTEKSGSHNIGSSADFVASATNTVASNKTVTLSGATSGVEVNVANDTTVNGILGLNNLTLKGHKLTLGDTDEANLKVTDSTIKNDLKLNGGDTEVKNSSLNGEIEMANTSILTFASGVNTVNGTITGTQGTTLVIDAPTIFNNTVDPVSEMVNSLAIHKANVSQVDFAINNGGELNFTQDSYLNNDHTNMIGFNGGTLNLMNGTASTITLQELSFAPATESVTISSLGVDVDLANKTMDKLVSNSINVGSGSILNISDMRLLSDAKDDNTSINFTENADLKEIVMTSKTSAAYSPIYQYAVDYNSQNGNFNFTRSLNPSILASSVAAQVGSYLTQVNAYEQAFGNMDMMMSMTKEQRQALKFANKYAAAGSGANLTTFSPNQIPEQNAGIWFRPYTTFESVGLGSGPTVGNVAYGTLFGGDSPIKELKNGWSSVFTAFAGYNGSNQTYDTVGIYQNGGTLGATSLFYKGNFFTGLTANVGASIAEASTMYGKEDFTMLTTGIASKTGYNWELANGKFIIQPNYLMSYSFVNTFNYTNAAGVNISSDPLNAIQIAPGIKFIGNFKNGWQPYASVQMVWNLMDQTKFKANDAALPEFSIAPYIQYGLGVQKRWGERLTGYGQVMLRNGGRNGIELQLGFRWALGKKSEKITENAKKISENAEPKKCNVNLQAKI